MTRLVVEPLTEEEVEELRRIRSRVDKILEKNITNPIVRDMGWLLRLLERFG
jgi:hypothetical protein